MKTIAKFLVGSSMLALAAPAMAQSEETVTVSASRIVAEGFTAPTPVTAISQDRLLERAPSNIPDALNQLPQFRGSTSNATSTTWNTNRPTQGNYLNLRNLGFNRTLVLLDGVRVPATNYDSAVDINTLPQALVERVEVVTGGASAAWGSDAVVGVVNFVLNKKFDGLRTVAQGGISSHGDGSSYKTTIVAGTSFDGGRGHIEGAFDHYWNDGIHNINKRQNGGDIVANIGGRTIANPAYTFTNARYRQLSTGGTIWAPPGPTSIPALHLMQFQPDSSIKPLDRGQETIIPGKFRPNGDPWIADANYQVGGSGGAMGGSSLTSRLRTETLFLRGDYDITDSIRGHIQVNGSEAANKFRSRYDDRFPGTSNGINIQRDNAYLSPSIVALMGSAQSVQMGRVGTDMPQDVARVITQSGMINAGFDGELNLLGNEWHWNASWTYGAAMLRVHQNENNNQRFYAAIDAVKDGNGNVVCRVTLTNPSLLPGCVPMNILGAGAFSPQAIAYTQGDAGYWTNNSTAIWQGSASGTLFDLPAGPLTMALGAESRHVTLKQRTNADPGLAGSVSYAGIRGVPTGVLISNFTNIGAADGSQDVNEGFVEFNIPILKDLPLIQSLSFNPAARYTEYKTSGAVTTWKAGANWQVYDDLRMRATLSRDIAAPTLFQLYAGTQTATANRPDLHTGASGVNTIEETGGNPLLKPEVSSMWVAGLVYSPSYVPGLTTSIDYYHIKIKGAISPTNTVQNILDCENSNGTASICQYIVRPLPFSDRSPANVPIKSILVTLNQAYAYAEGWDFEAAYRFAAADIMDGWDGNLELHGYASLTTSFGAQTTPVTPVISTNNQGVNAVFRASFEAIYSTDLLNVRIGLRDVGDTIRTTTGFYQNYMNEPDRWYTDVTVSYVLDGFSFMDWMGENTSKQVFVTANNLFGVRPPIVSDCCNPGLQYPTDRTKYDVIGSYYTVGIRANF
jgi:outer membrane receptor protein involved in Fe transport